MNKKTKGTLHSGPSLRFLSLDNLIYLIKVASGVRTKNWF